MQSSVPQMYWMLGLATALVAALIACLTRRWFAWAGLAAFFAGALIVWVLNAPRHLHWLVGACGLWILASTFDDDRLTEHEREVMDAKFESNQSIGCFRIAVWLLIRCLSVVAVLTCLYQAFGT